MQDEQLRKLAREAIVRFGRTLVGGDVNLLMHFGRTVRAQVLQPYAFLEALHETAQCSEHPEAPLTLTWFFDELVIGCSANHLNPLADSKTPPCSWHQHLTRPKPAAALRGDSEEGK